MITQQQLGGGDVTIGQQLMRGRTLVDMARTYGASRRGSPPMEGGGGDASGTLEGGDDEGGDNPERKPAVQVYSWMIFIGVYMLAWNLTMPGVINKMNDETDNIDASGEPIRRTFLIGITMYAVVVAWLKTLLLMMFGYVGCSFFMMAAKYSIMDAIERLLLTLFNPAFIFHSVSTAHIAFHALVCVSTIAAAFGAIVFYITNEDLKNLQAMRSKMVRILFAVPAASFAIYGLYGLFCLIKSR